MTNLSNESFFSLLRAAHRVLAETAEQERDRASQDLYTRLQNIEIQKVLDEISDVLYNGSYTPQAKLEAVIEIVNELGSDEDDSDYDDEGDEVRLGGVTPVNHRPTT
jgi:hypothetical protein